MASEWPIVKLGDICDKIGSGATPKGGKDAYCSEGISLIRSQNVLDFAFSDDGLAYINDEQARKLNNVEVQSGDVLLNITGDSVARVCIVEDGYLPARVNQHVAIVRGNGKKVISSYLLYFLQMEKPHLLQLASAGATRNALTKGMIEQLELVLPPLDVQRRMVAILDSLQQKIRTNNMINDNLEQQAATVFGDWLSKCTETASIGDLSNNILDYTPIAAEMVRLLNSSDVTEGVFPVAPLVPNKDLKGHFKKRFQFDDILYSEIRPRNHHYGYVMFDASEYIASTRLMVIRAITSKVSPALLYQYLLLPDVEAEFTLKTESRSGTFPQGNYADMASIMVPYSSIESQSAVSDVLLQIRKTIAQNQLENRHLEELRDTLLPRLMSGEIDVSAIDI